MNTHLRWVALRSCYHAPLPPVANGCSAAPAPASPKSRKSILERLHPEIGTTARHKILNVAKYLLVNAADPTRCGAAGRCRATQRCILTVCILPSPFAMRAGAIAGFRLGFPLGRLSRFQAILSLCTVLRCTESSTSFYTLEPSLVTHKHIPARKPCANPECKWRRRRRQAQLNAWKEA